MQRSFLKIFNFLTIKNKKKIYCVPHTNGKKDCYDLINYTADNVLCFVNAFLRNYKKGKVIIYLERFDTSRDDAIKKYIEEQHNENVKIVLLDSYNFKTGFAKLGTFLRNTFIRFKCKIWIVDTCFVHFFDKVKSQVFVNLNYSTPLKSSNGYKKSQFFKNVDYYFETSFMTSCIHSAEYLVPLPNCLISGFPRNDNLFIAANKNNIINWLRNKTNAKFDKIIVYAPTYRDYHGAYEGKNVLGFEDADDSLYKFLTNNGIVLITKFHPLQDVSNSRFNDRIIKYESTYNFTLYDLLSISDALISDYSSVIHDYLLTNKPVILDFFDESKYRDSRGFAFDPIENICPGPICTALPELLNAINQELNSRCRNDKYFYVKNFLHKYQDSRSTQRALELIDNLLN